MYLIFNFTQLVDLSSSATEVVGVTHRIGQLMERLETLQRRRDSRSPSPEPAKEEASEKAPPASEEAGEAEKEAGEKAVIEGGVAEAGEEEKTQEVEER